MTRKTASTTRRLGVLGLSALLCGCTMAPDYVRPAMPVQTAYPSDTHAASVPAHVVAADLGWRDFFVDERLKALIALAIRDNRSLRSQIASISEAQGQYEVQHASLFPPISATGNGEYFAPSSTAGFSFAPGLGQNISMLRYYSAGIGFSAYEVDLFGRIRSLSQEQAEDALASEENARSVLTSTIAEVATTYISWLADRELLRVTNDTLASQQHTLDLTQTMYDHGETDLLTLQQTRSQVQQAAANQAQYERQMGLDAHALQLAVGAPLPADLPEPAPFGQQTILSDLPAGLPSDLIARRPDVVQAEHTLKAANANIGAARAAFFPRVTITASDGISSLQFRHLFTPGATTWSAAPSITLPIFTWGQNEGNLRISKARKLEQIATYERTVQTAFREVSDALTARETYLAQDRQLDGLVQSDQDAYRLAQMRFSSGIDSYLTTLEQQRSLYQAQQTSIAVKSARFQNLVTLYRALGGGWVDHTPPTRVASAAAAR
ncbi:efflux transporter outer membrane subunit [Tanticharoenia sakaeratensis]|uniref:Outer membrane protein oprM n=1 Tax=Tanticharoenia sakaeratensis NBRC 103193 TaxID=1231623 RepID=A0A0D6MHK8_9PROT|nr:efflux transporter outer membrane subunit [Tanticharoenia sakaeratensis]GAN52986.1 outer membrane protein oprM [Tanticharoenia sakaeratensis NBRC 103193]GBQ19853.1 secretion system type I outer membrane efflux pump lipoprotein NodT [Tanticharoenia sakaeratensis NBRC 103193]